MFAPRRTRRIDISGSVGSGAITAMPCTGSCDGAKKPVVPRPVTPGGVVNSAVTLSRLVTESRGYGRGSNSESGTTCSCLTPSMNVASTLGKSWEALWATLNLPDVAAKLRLISTAGPRTLGGRKCVVSMGVGVTRTLPPEDPYQTRQCHPVGANTPGACSPL